jgi:hypothetical protein
LMWDGAAGFAVILFGVVLSAAEPTTPVAVLILTTAVGFLTMVVQGLFAARSTKAETARLALQHEWDKQDRAAKAADLATQTKADAELVALRTEATTAQLKLLIEQRLGEVKGLVSANTDLTQKALDHAQEAFHEANAVNGKIADLNERLTERV